MGRVIINGTLMPVKRPDELDYDPVRGLILTKEFHSAGDNLAGVANLYLNAKTAYHWTRSPVVSKIVATISGGQDGLPDIAPANWQLLCNETQKSIFTCKYALDGLATYPNLFDDVNWAVSLLRLGDDSSKAEEATFEEALPDGEVPIFTYLVNKLLAGETSYAKGQYVLRRTYSISNFYDGPPLPGEAYAECLLSNDAVVMFDMPTPIQVKLLSIPVVTPHTGYLWGWRQLPSTMTTSAQNRVEVSTEWWLDEWDANLYPHVI